MKEHARDAATSAGVRWLSRASWAWLAVACVLGGALWGLGDAWWPATVLLFIGRWIFLLPLAVLVPAVLVVRRSLLVPLALAALVVAGPVMGFRTGWRRLLPHSAGTHVRLVTFNANNDARVAADLPLILAGWDADIVALQECDEVIAEAARRIPAWHLHVVRQLCLLSRYPILDTQVMDRSALEQVNEDEAAHIGGSGDVARYALQTPQGVVSVTNLHLETPRKGLEDLLQGAFNPSRLRANTHLRAIESTLARRWVDSSRSPALVAGDFNTPVESRIFQKSWADLTDAFSRAGFGLGMTKDNGWIKVRIDHVLSGPGWVADRAVVGGDLGSDHLPLIVDLTLVGGSRRPGIANSRTADGR